MKKPTITDVARASGVSKKTVSRVINGSTLLAPATRAKVETVIAELGYTPDPMARALALGTEPGHLPDPLPRPRMFAPHLTESRIPRRAPLVALVHDGSDPDIFHQAHNGVLDALSGTEHALAVHRIQRGTDASLAEFVACHRPSAVILLPALSARGEYHAICGKAGAAAIGLGGAEAGDTHDGDGGGGGAAPVRRIGADERAAMALAVRRIAALGHRRIALVSGPENCRASAIRELGYLDAMADLGLDGGAVLIGNGDFSFQSGREAGALMLNVSPRPTAIVAVNDAMAMGVLHAAMAQGIAVPQTLSLAGFGGSRAGAQSWPPLASMDLPWRAVAARATLLLTGKGLGSGRSGDAPVFEGVFHDRATMAPPADVST